MKDSIILLSGGMDSTTLLYEYKDRIKLSIFINYGSKHNHKELEYSIYHSKMLNIEHMIINIDLSFLNSSLLNKDIEVPEGHYEDIIMKSTVVPFRNGIMLSYACAICEDHGLKYVMLSNHSGDHAIYPDCRPSFIENMSKAMYDGTYNNINILAPYTNISKRDIAIIGKKLGVDYSKTWSCYKGGDVECGLCGCCVEKKEALS